MVLAKVMTPDEADKVWSRMIGTMVPDRPSEIALKVLYLLGEVRHEEVDWWKRDHS